MQEPYAKILSVSPYTTYRSSVSESSFKRKAVYLGSPFISYVDEGDGLTFTYIIAIYRGFVSRAPSLMFPGQFVQCYQRFLLQAFCRNTLRSYSHMLHCRYILGPIALH